MSFLQAQSTEVFRNEVMQVFHGRLAINSPSQVRLTTLTTTSLSKSEMRGLLCDSLLTVWYRREHLYRSHILPIRCFRCSQIFSNSKELAHHLRAVVPCTLMEHDFEEEGISPEQLELLKSRKRRRDNHSDHDKWVNIYKILFKNEQSIPSPCK